MFGAEESKSWALAGASSSPIAAATSTALISCATIKRGHPCTIA